MGQKVNPNGFRYGITKERHANWYASKHNFAQLLLEDQKIRKFFEDKVRTFQIGEVDIERTQDKKVKVIIHSAMPGKILGQGGDNIKKLETEIQKATKNKKLNISIQVEQIAKPELNARLIAEDIAIKLENRGSFRAAQKWAIRNAFRAGAKGIKTAVAGRLNGVDMARSEGYTEGEMRLHTLRQNVDYGTARANTTYGVIGIKVWVSRGEIVSGGKK